MNQKNSEYKESFDSIRISTKIHQFRPIANPKMQFHHFWPLNDNFRENLQWPVAESVFFLSF